MKLWLFLKHDMKRSERLSLFLKLWQISHMRSRLTVHLKKKDALVESTVYHNGEYEKKNQIIHRDEDLMSSIEEKYLKLTVTVSPDWSIETYQFMYGGAMRERAFYRKHRAHI